MLVNVFEDETRIALIEDNNLLDLHVEQTARGRTAGNIYRGTILKVNPAFQAAFVDYGEKKNGFLSISDLNPNFFDGHPDGNRPRIQSLLRRGQKVMLQVLKEGVGAKGAAMSTNIGLPGRYMVLSPYSDRSGVSRKIDESDDRNRLKEFLTGLSDGGMGVIIRTAGIDRSLTELKKDFNDLRREWKSILDRFEKSSSPGLLYQEPGSVVRVLRDYFSEDVQEVWVDAPEAYQVALEYFKRAMPKFQKRLKLYVDDRPLFGVYQIEGQIESLDESKVNLRSGGSIVIESTEAMVSIDVNSGRSNQESDIEETALRSNLEAAEEIGRQLRLRNLGGLIVVDFIDMFRKANQQKIVRAMTDALKHDKARTRVGSISQFGLLELSRQRIDMELSRGLRTPCSYCAGTGHVPTAQASANQVLRKIRELAAQGSGPEIHGTLPLNHANYLLNHRRENLTDLELEFEIRVHLYGDAGMAESALVHLSSDKRMDLSESEPAQHPLEPKSRSEHPSRLVSLDEPLEADGKDGSDTDESDGDIRRKRRRRRRPRDDAEWSGNGDSPRSDSQTAIVTGAEEANEPPESEPGQSSSAVKSVDESKPDLDAPIQGSPTSVGYSPQASTSPPTTFSLGRRRVRRELGFGDRAAVGQEIYVSQHAPAEPGREAVLITPAKRGGALLALGANAELDQVMFQSQHRSGNGSGSAAAESVGDEVKRPRSRGRRAPLKRSGTASTATSKEDKQETRTETSEATDDGKASSSSSSSRSRSGREQGQDGHSNSEADQTSAP